MFDDTNQRLRACYALLNLAGGTLAEDLWNTDGTLGPTYAAHKHLNCIRNKETWFGNLSRGERIVLQVAFDFYNGQGKARIDDIMYFLDNRLCEAIAQLMSAVSRGTVIDWLKTWE